MNFFSRLFVLTISLAVNFLCAPADAKLFRNMYISFELPERWNCSLDGTEWVCRVTEKIMSPDEPREAAIILTAKEQGPMDSLEAYEGHLKQPKTLASLTGQPIQSKVQWVRREKINDWEWVDSFHDSSEVPRYFTRYLATVKDKIGMAITFSAHHAHYAKYVADFNSAVRSLRVLTVARGGGAGDGSGGDGSGAGGLLGDGGEAALSGDGESDDLEPRSGGLSNSTLVGGLLALAAIFAAAGVYHMRKKK